MAIPRINATLDLDTVLSEAEESARALTGAPLFRVVRDGQSQPGMGDAAAFRAVL